jgi:hypothetical protein
MRGANWEYDWFIRPGVRVKLKKKQKNNAVRRVPARPGRLERQNKRAAGVNAAPPARENTVSQRLSVIVSEQLTVIISPVGSVVNADANTRKD